MKRFILLLFTISLLFSCKNEPQKLVKIEGKLLPITEKIESVKEIDDFIKPYKIKVESEMNTVLSYTPKDLVRTDGELESTLGNLMADLCYQRANPVFYSRTKKNIDFVMLNFGGIRAGITKGDIKTQNAFQLMPFENNLVVAELSSEKVLELADYLLKSKRAHPLSKQIKAIIENNKINFKINNKSIEKDRTYFVLTSDYLQNGGDSMNFFKNPVELYKIDYKVRNAIIDYFKEVDTIKVELDGRFIKK
ncbi:5'-nucleotidase C-terminal domain-containing protein [Lutibacter sp. TH_r2]|uniref:5'-nucleotidase C-terminal domain-containing protein n=1 Tax=Lutibacter sp. TH_r2 TaxID=3082083 RepID=UPI002953E181|nr:5'-nucleotidase C-terminal domain-containing protein [Lutibacter sp. TH_r2]MDV7188496.1 5'-nucleotidase C-terminal domain-containing protein [Lutibacter sp. TH_r2]